jgi:phage shock protein C
VSRDKRDAERAARRAKRLAERAEERASRKERHAQRAAERAERLAERVQRRPSREKDLDRSIEDLVDEVTQKAEEWIDQQTGKLFEADDSEVRRAKGQAQKAQAEARKARDSARRAEKAAEDLSDLEHAFAGDDDFGMGDDAMDYEDDLDVEFDLSPNARKRARKRARRREARARRYGYGRHSGIDDWGFGSRSKAKRRRSAHLYKDRQRKKICGVCAGTADYFGRPAWEIRLYAVLGLFIVPSVVVPLYFVMYFLMDDKPYYRRVTDRFAESADTESFSDESGANARAANRSESRRSHKRSKARNNMRDESNAAPAVSNVQAMKTAKDKFANIEQRLRQMETHVTSSRFELQREFKKISGED